MSYRFVIARFNHETNTFSPIATPLEAFNPMWDGDAYRDQKGARTAMGAFIEIAEAIPGATMTTPVAAMAYPSGTVEAEAYEAISAAILKAVEAGCDAIMLDLHGAMVARQADDGEGTLLQRIRELAPGVPICVALDLHGNVTRKMVENCDIIVSFKTYPHIDMYETGAHAGRLLVDMLEKRIAPVMTWRQLPLLSHTLMSNTSASAMQRAVNAAVAAEAEPDILAVSVLAGFSLADFNDAGVSAVVVANRDRAHAEAVADRIADLIWNERRDFVYASEPLSQSLQRAKELAAGPGSGPVLLLDHSDNVMSGGSCDTMDVLQAALAAGLANIAAGPIWDPEAVAELVKVGVGGTATVALGNKTRLDALGLTKQAPVMTGIVRQIGDGRFRVSGPIYTGSIVNMGRTVLFDIGAAQIVVTEERVEPYDVGVYTCVGINPAEKSYLVLKSRMYCRPVFEPLGKGLVECDSDSGGPTSSNYALFSFKKVRRPVYPLDDVAGA
ncbi:M81 family metallopeptidase [Noviherbaspirillum galbum]|uniref:Microcystinase C n=1 Tax=Noviherbaspirillum galbum TaxID=2709383 RepID=A0A6B3SUF1_9BURK|nr:M81 family metallopeptidase [Noviherbaspirillum galbum]NEX62995.1 M81 family metallopeptidase [Noviherbaspirillum galbum]